MGKTTGKKPVAVFDLDGSLVREQLLVLLTKECLEQQIFRKIVDRKFRKMRLAHRDRKTTFEVFDKQLIELFTERIKGKLKGDVEEAAEVVAEKHRDWLYVFSRTLLDRLKGTHECVTITGAMVEVVALLAPYWGFEHFYGTELEIDELGRYTGKNLSLPVADKKAALAGHLEKTGAGLEGSVALGDTGSDIPMLEMVELPIAFNPNVVLATEAEKNGWPIIVERKDCIYVLGGGGGKRFSRLDADQAVDYVLGLSAGGGSAFGGRKPRRRHR